MAKNFLVDKLKSIKHKKHKKHVDPDGQPVIEVHPLTSKPTEAWQELQEHHPVIPLDPEMYLHSAVKQDHLRFVCLSDTHGAAESSQREYHKRVPDGDVLIHCGDFTMGGDPNEIIKFDSFIGRLPHPVKLVIAGNHELTFEGEYCGGVHHTMIRKKLGLPMKATWPEIVDGCKALLTHMMYLQDETLDLCGIKIYGSPWVPEFGTWGFSVRRGHNLLQKWNQIPSNTDVLITHGPPLGYGDDVGNGKSKAGCAELLNTVVSRVKPKFHVFGHIHGGRGMWTNRTTTFINAAVCSNKYKPDHNPIVFDIPLPRGYSRKDFDLLSTESLRQARNAALQTNDGVVDDRFQASQASQEEEKASTSKQLALKEMINNDVRKKGKESVKTGVTKESKTLGTQNSRDLGKTGTETGNSYEQSATLTMNPGNEVRKSSRSDRIISSSNIAREESSLTESTGNRNPNKIYLEKTTCENSVENCGKQSVNAESFNVKTNDDICCSRQTHNQNGYEYNANTQSKDENVSSIRQADNKTGTIQTTTDDAVRFWKRDENDAVSADIVARCSELAISGDTTDTDTTNNVVSVGKMAAQWEARNKKKSTV